MSLNYGGVSGRECKLRSLKTSFQQPANEQLLIEKSKAKNGKKEPSTRL
jgi:hypothetical protein